MRMLFAAATAALVMTGALQAQNGNPANCHGLLTATLNSGRAHGDMAACAKHTVPEYVEQVRSAPQADITRLSRLMMYASYVRDPSVLSAAWDLASDRNAPGPARNLGLLLAVSMHQRALVPVGVHSYGRLLTGQIPSSCYLAGPTAGGYWVNNPLPPDELAQTVARARAIRSDSTTPEATRRLAECIASDLGRDIPDPSIPANVRVRFVCGQVYEITNETDRYVTLEWTVDGSDQTGGVTVAPHAAQRLFVENPGLLRVQFEDNVIGTALAVARPCDA